ncbi:MAG: 50S ribosomal protein L31 [Spirochaetes bacterium]|nr:50S ribosomal protein L31 [Spirochaetota bacterium]
MKKEIHPAYVTTPVTCACGAKFEVKSVLKSIHVDICYNCHPHYTGKQKLSDVGGRIDRFKKRYGLKQ